MIVSVTSVILAICITLATFAMLICAATLAVASPWWPHHKRTRHGRGSTKKTLCPTNILCRTVEAFALISPQTATRARDGSRRSSIFVDNLSLPLRFQPERFYGSTNPRNASTRSSICSFQTASTGEGFSEGNTVTTIGGLLAPPTMRPRSGSTSLLHDLAKGSYEDISPIPVFMSTVSTQPKPTQDVIYPINPPERKAGDGTTERRKSLRATRRTTLGSLSPKPVTKQLGASLSELLSILDTQVSRSTTTSPSRKRRLWSAAMSPTATPPLSHISPSSCFTPAEAPGGTINYRVFIDATGKNNLTVRVHLYYATKLPTIRPWKNSNYVVKAALIGFKSHFVQTSGAVTAACGSPRFSEGNPSVLDFVLDCGMPFNKSEEEVQLRLMIIEFGGRKPGEKSLMVAKKEYRFTRHTLKGKSTLSTDINWERCKPCIDVYQMTADVLTSLSQRETEGSLRFEFHEIRNLSFRQLHDNPANIESSPKNTALYPIKIRLRACLVTNNKATCVRKGFNIRVPTEFADCTFSGKASGALVLKDHVFNESELVLTFRPPFAGSLDKQEVFNKVGMRPVQWRILAFFVFILEDNSDHSSASRRVRAIGSCCLGSNAQNIATVGSTPITNEGILRLISGVASESSRCQVSQWLHIE